MDYFDVAVQVVIEHEGGYVNHPSDPGGATNFGVSLRFLKSLGVAIGDLDDDGDVDDADIKLITLGFARSIYKQCWWDKYSYHRITNKGVAIKLLDFAVNMGHTRAVINLQRAVRAASGIALINDGILGNKTIRAVNLCKDEPLTVAYMCETAGFYRSLNKPDFITGWLNRAYSRDHLPF